MSERARYDMDAEMAAMRTPIDAKWTPKKKRVVGGACVAGAAAVLTLGVWAATANSAPGLPKSADEAIAVMGSGKFDRLDDERKRQYAAEAGRLFRAMSDEERRRLMQDEQAREALRAMREEMFDDFARRYARGEEMPMPRPGEGRPQRPPGGEGERPRPMQEMTEEERAAMREQMRARANERVNEQVESGNAQSGGLRSEMMKRRGGGGGPGGGRPGGGGPRG